MGIDNPHVNETVAQGALEGDYKIRYRKRIKEELKRPGQGVDKLLNLRYAKKKSKTKTG